jgi:hypothetical protein
VPPSANSLHPERGGGWFRTSVLLVEICLYELMGMARSCHGAILRWQ